MAFDTQTFRQALGNFVTGVTIVTTRDSDGAPRGFTANSFTSVSLDPPLVLVCLGNSASSHDAFADCTDFNIHILADTQRDLSNHFASKHLDKFEGISWTPATNGSPCLPGALSTLQCTLHKTITAGDHLILMGRVEDFEYTGNLPLTFFRGGYIAPGLGEHDIDRIDGMPTVQGCLAQWQERILLVRRAGSDQWQLPLSTIPDLEAMPNARTRMLELFEPLGVTLDLLPPYSVFENETDSVVYVLYRAVFEKEPDLDAATDGLEFALFTADDLPWNQLREDLYHGMLRRYFREQKSQRFGRYFNVASTRL